MPADDNITIPLLPLKWGAVVCVALLAVYGIFYISVDHVRITEDELEAARDVMETNPNWWLPGVLINDVYDGELLPYNGYFGKSSSGNTVMSSNVPPVAVKHAGQAPPGNSGPHEAILLVNGADRGVHEVIWLDGERTDLIPHRTIWESPPGGPP